MSLWTNSKSYMCEDLCNPFGCLGHVMSFDFQDTADIGSLYIDGERIFSGGQSQLRTLDAIFENLRHLWD